MLNFVSAFSSSEAEDEAGAITGCGPPLLVLEVPPSAAAAAAAAAAAEAAESGGNGGRCRGCDGWRLPIIKDFV